MKKNLTQEILAIISLLHIHLIIDSTWNHIGCYIYIAIYELLMIESNTTFQNIFLHFNRYHIE